MIKSLVVRFGLVLAVAVSVTWGAQAFDAKRLDQSIQTHFAQFTDCEVNVDFHSIRPLNEVDWDYTKILPVLRPDDLDVIADISWCETSDKYSLTVRIEGGTYSVVSYSSFDQPQ